MGIELVVTNLEKMAFASGIKGRIKEICYDW